MLLENRRTRVYKIRMIEANKPLKAVVWIHISMD